MHVNRNSFAWCTATALFSLFLSVPVAFSQKEPDSPDAVPENIDIEEATTSDDNEAAYDNMELLTQVMLHVKKHYYKEKTLEEITHGALHGLLRGLDEHSAFLAPQAYEEMKDDTSGTFSGIGIHIGMRDGLLTVIAPIEDTPAFRAGLQAGDRIVKIDDKSTMGITLRDAVKKLRGPKGDPVKMTVRRADEENLIDIEIVRDEITMPSVKGTRVIRDGVGYVRITQFAKPTVALLDEALAELKSKGMDALVLDLRNNPGGLLKAAIAMSDRFLDKEQVIVSTKGRLGVKGEIKYASSGASVTDVPMVVLINIGSASASEIVAGALQDNKRAVLVGDATFGKGSVQSVIRLKPNGESAIRLTTALYYTPNGRQIHGVGIDPDIPVYVSPKQWRRTQIKRAHVENPKLYSAEEKAEYADANDRALLRAVDLLLAMKIVGKHAAGR